MALQVRRGTNAERLGITPALGELIFTTDSNRLYVGDGSTAGGLASAGLESLIADTTPQLGGNLDLNGQSITGTGSINITGTISASGNINLGDGVAGDVLVIGGSIQGNLVPDTDITWNLGSPSKQFNEAWISQLNVENQLTVGRIMGDIIADDSTVVFDSSTGLVAAAQVSGTFTGNVVGSLDGVVGATTPAVGSFTNLEADTIDGDVTGSVFTNDSTLVIDGINGNIHASTIVSGGTVVVDRESAGTSLLKVNGNNEYGALHLTTKGAGDLSAGSGRIGQVIFSVEDVSGISSYASITGSRTAMFLAHAADKDFGPSTKYVIWSNGKLGVGKDTEALATLEVAGDSIVSGYTLFGRITTTQRNALTAANGMVIYNTTDNKFQGYENGAWASLI
jgi:hypothetical protein